MHSLEEIYQKVAVTQALSPDTSQITSGNYASTNLTLVDPDLAAINIANGVSIFGTLGILNTIPSAIAKTGQTASYRTGDDGALQKGVAWPSPRFSVLAGQASNCIVDNLTRMMWVRNPTALPMVWSNALAYCVGLDGSEGLGGYSDWRLPNKSELESLVACQYFAPALPNTVGADQLLEGDPFAGVQSSGVYWSSSAYVASDSLAWALSAYDGASSGKSLTNECYVWAVRGGYVEGQRSEYNVSGEDKGTIPASSFAGQCNLTPVKPGSLHLFINGGVDGQFIDDGLGILSGSFNIGGGVFHGASGTLDYASGAYAINFGVLGGSISGKAFSISYSAVQ